MNNLNNARLNFGFSEMYEWSEIPFEGISLYGKIVQFDPDYPEKIRLAKNEQNIVGITTLNSVIDSDDPDHWMYQNIFNGYGDIFLKNNSYYKCEESYDSELEIKKLNLIKCDELIPYENPEYDKNKEYIKRSNRQEWIRINLLGKCIIEDDGNCIPGNYCTLYKGEDKTRYGTVMPANGNERIKLYILCRVSTNSILVLNRNIW